jgi:hypothetical protein
MTFECPNITRKANERSVMDTARGEMVEKELDALITRRHDHRISSEDHKPSEEMYEESTRRYNARRREEMRAAWCEHHHGQAARLRAVLEPLIARHEEQAAKLMDLVRPKGA